MKKEINFADYRVIKEKSSCEVSIVLNESNVSDISFKAYLVNVKQYDVVYLQHFMRNDKNTYSIFVDNELILINDEYTKRDTSWITNWENNRIINQFELVRIMYFALIADKWDEARSFIDSLNEERRNIFKVLNEKAEAFKNNLMQK